jgi:SAM-dependent methyltransferase
LPLQPSLSPTVPKLSLPPSISTWTLPTLQLDAPRAFIVSDFCDMAKKYGFDKKKNNHRRILVTNPVDAELRCMGRPSEVVHFEYNPDTQEGDLHAPFTLGKVDFILLSQTLEHLFSPILVLCNLYDALHVGGYLFVSVPSINKRHSGSVNDPNGVFHFTHYTPAGLMAALMSVGFNGMSTLS